MQPLETWARPGLAIVLALAIVAALDRTDARATSGDVASRYVPAAGCPAEPLGLAEDLSRRRPGEAGYPVCVDQNRLLDAALDEAAREGKVVLASFGAPWCPQCRALMADLAALRATPAGHSVLGSIVPVHLSTSAVVGGRRVAVPGGEAALARFAGSPEMEPLRAIPYLVVIAPDGRRTVGRNLDSLGAGRDGIDRDTLLAALARAVEHVRTGAPPPPGATWLGRLLRRIGLR